MSSITDKQRRRTAHSARSKKVALTFLNGSEWARRVQAGIATYAVSARNWDFWLQPMDDILSGEASGEWDGDGIIGRFSPSPLSVSSWLGQRAPKLVNIFPYGEHRTTLPLVTTNLSMCGRVAGEFFSQRGYRELAYVGPNALPDKPDPVLQSLHRLTTQDGLRFHHLHQDTIPELGGDPFVYQSMIQYLSKQSGPVAVVTWSAQAARKMILQALRMGWRVPEDFAFLCIEHNSMEHEIGPISITYVMQRPQVIGIEAASLLDRLMNGASAPGQPQLIDPFGIYEADSTRITIATKNCG